MATMNTTPGGAMMIPTSLKIPTGRTPAMSRLAFSSSPFGSGSWEDAPSAAGVVPAPAQREASVTPHICRPPASVAPQWGRSGRSIVQAGEPVTGA
jgi:hypothetical protein